jgi:hypothetical protein
MLFSTLGSFLSVSLSMMADEYTIIELKKKANKAENKLAMYGC